jgi:hypothetical protein
MNWPKQLSSQDIFAFYNDFIDNIRLRSIFLDGHDDMKSSHMIDCFIQSCHHSTYLTQVSRFDRTDPNKTHLFAPGNLAITLTNYLANADSPLKKTSFAPTSFAPPPHVPSPGGHHGDNKPRNPYHRRIRTLLSDEENFHSDREPSTLTITEYDTLSDIAIREVRTHDDPTAAPICVFCKTETHRFKECPLMNDTAFLRSFAIRMCTTVAKELRSAKHRLANPTEGAHLRQVHTSLSPQPATVLPDFRPGQD